jgi:hypothetical protein
VDKIIELIFQSYGIIGVILFLPTGGMVAIWRAYMKREKDSAKELAEANLRIEQATKARVEDAKAVSDKLMELVSEQSGLNKETNLALGHINNLLERMR